MPPRPVNINPNIYGPMSTGLRSRRGQRMEYAGNAVRARAPNRPTYVAASVKFSFINTGRQPTRWGSKFHRCLLARANEVIE